MNSPLKTMHTQQAAKAKVLYCLSLKPADGATDWKVALSKARRFIARALRSSKFLRNISAALQSGGASMLVFRQLLSPPISQDQFKLLCEIWPKSSEKSDAKLKATVADAAAIVLEQWRNKRLTRWLDHGGNPTFSELRHLMQAISPLIAAQQVATDRRNRLAREQESAVIDLLLQKGWAKLPSKLINARGDIPLKSFMHKTRFATATATPQEVDIACGLKDTVVLAMECKVTNDETNSVKRINDVLKKAHAWRTHYGNFVVTAAVLQGVIRAKDVERLIDSNVEVFWSHDLDRFSTWLDSKL